MKYKLTLAILPALFMMTGCGKGPKCWGDNKNKGIVVSSVEIPCLPNAEQKQFVIASDSLYKAIFTDQQSGTMCNLPGIDFNTHSLLGQESRSSGCEAKFIQEVQKEDASKKYVYEVKVKECGICKPLRISYHWVTVPKIPQGWTVDFKVDVK
jgi:hypothetical protein